MKGKERIVQVLLALLLAGLLPGGQVQAVGPCVRMGPVFPQAALKSEAMPVLDIGITKVPLEDELLPVPIITHTNKLSICGGEKSPDEPKPQVQPISTTASSSNDSGINLKGGHPWVDSNAKSNVTANTPASPGEDYSIYANKQWILTSEIKPDKVEKGAFDDAEEVMNQKLHGLLQDSSLTGHNAELVQALYHKYLDWDARNKLGVQPLKQEMAAIQNVKTLGELSKLLSSREGLLYPNYIISYVMPQWEDTSVYGVGIQDGFDTLLGFTTEFTVRTDVGRRRNEANQLAFGKMMERLGYTQKDAVAMYKDALELEAELAEYVYTSEDKLSQNFIAMNRNPMTPAQVEALVPNYPLHAYFVTRRMDKAKVINVEHPAYLRGFNQLYTQRNLNRFKNDMLVRLVLSRLQSLDRAADDVGWEFNKMNFGFGRPSDERLALREVKRDLLEPLEQVYLASYASPQMKADITNLCKKIISYYRTMLQEETWLSDATRQMALRKLDHMVIHAAYPNKFYDYGSLDISQDSFWEAQRKCKLFALERAFDRVDTKVDPDDWNQNILQCNASYYPLDNSINIMVGILNPPFYVPGMADEELYGGIGAVIGHEITHAFDTNGAQFDEKGNLRNWWTKVDYEKFQDRAKRVREYYDNIVPFDGIHLNGAFIQTEAIADMTGLKAMLSILAQKPNADYDRFFRAYAKIWVYLATPQAIKYILYHDVHPLSYLRINVTLQQFDEFYRTYHVKKGDTMYLDPEDRILVW